MKPRQAARLSWQLPLVTLLIVAFTKGHLNYLLALLVVGMLAVGAGAAVFALKQVPFSGRSGVLVPGIVGLAVNALLLLSAAIGYVSKLLD